MTESSASQVSQEKPQVKSKGGLFNSLYTGDGGIDFIGKSKIWYWITAALLIVSILFIALRGFSLSIDFEGGTKMNMPAADYSTTAVEETFVEATGVEPETVQIVGSGESRTLEIHSERLSDEQIEKARLAIYEEFQPLNAEGQPSPDAIGNSTVSESGVPPSLSVWSLLSSLSWWLQQSILLSAWSAKWQLLPWSLW